MLDGEKDSFVYIIYNSPCPPGLAYFTYLSYRRRTIALVANTAAAVRNLLRRAAVSSQYQGLEAR